MAEDFLIRIIPEGVSGSGSGMLGSGGGSGKSPAPGGGQGFGIKTGGIFKAALKGLGIASGIGIIVSILSNMKGLMSIIGSIMKLISALLRPVERVITTLLMPILYMIKPFVILVNQVMSPFIKLAMSMMREGQMALRSGDTGQAGALFAGAGAVAMQGLSAVIVALSAELVKLAISNLFSGMSILINALMTMSQFVVTTILSIFGVSTDGINEYFDTMRAGVNDGLTMAKDLFITSVDTIAGNAVIAIAASSVFIAESLGVDTTKFQTDAKKMITSVFSGAAGLTTTWELAIGTAEGFGKKANVAITGTTGELSTEFGLRMGEFQTSGVTAVKSAVTQINAEWDKLIKSQEEFEEKKGFIEKMYTKAAEVAGFLGI